MAPLPSCPHFIIYSQVFTKVSTVPSPVLNGAGEITVTETALGLPFQGGQSSADTDVTSISEDPGWAGWDWGVQGSVGTQRGLFPQPEGYSGGLPGGGDSEI